MSRQLWLNVFVVWILFPMAASQAQQSPSDWRTWSSADKRFTVEAKFAGVDSTKICLERKQDGKTIEVPADKLSDADWAWLGPKLDPSVVAQQVALAQDQLAAAQKEFAIAIQNDPTYQTAERAVEKGKAKMAADTQQIINYLRHLHTEVKGRRRPDTYTLAGDLLKDFESYDRGLRGDKGITDEKLKERLNHDELTLSDPEGRRVVSNVTRDFDTYLKDRDEMLVADKHLHDLASEAADRKLAALKLALARWESVTKASTPEPTSPTPATGLAAIKAGHTPDDSKAGTGANLHGDDHRTKWLNVTYDASFRPTGEKQWAEFDNKTGRLLVSWEETRRTAELIELYCSDRQQKIRVSSERMELFKDGMWIWVANGRWTDGQTNLHAQSHRTAWLNTSYDLTLRPTGEKKWAEFENKTGRLHLSYDETGRTDESIELFCPERQQKVRVFAERMELFKDGKWQWVANGKWSEGQVR